MLNFKRVFKNANIVDRVFMIIVPVIIVLGIKDFYFLYTDSDSNNANDKEQLIASEEVAIKDNNNETNEKEESEYINYDNIEEISEEKDGNKVNDMDKQPNIHFEKSIKGRGKSDEGRSEPNYEGKYGYVAVQSGYDIRKQPVDRSWTIPTYKKIDYDHYEVNGELQHKTMIKVISQDLTHEGYGRYSGYLTVVIADDDKTQYIVDVSNFITNDYWNFDSVYSTIEYGCVIAEYIQVSDKLPVYKNNDIAEIQSGTKVLVEGKTGLYGRGLVDNDLREIEAYYFDENGYGSRIFFNKNDLKIIY